MSTPEIAAVLTATAALLGVLWTIYNGRKALIQQKETTKQQKDTSLFDDAVKMINAYKEDSVRKDAEIENLRKQVEVLTRRVALLERKNARLMRALSKAQIDPGSLIDLLDDDNGTATQKP